MEYQIIPKDAASEALLPEALNYLNEVAPRLLRGLAARSGMSISDLHMLAEQGKLTSAVLLGEVDRSYA